MMATCERCKFMDLVADDADGTPFYVCRRFPPIVAHVDGMENGPTSTWPSVEPNHWCGEWAAQS